MEKTTLGYAVTGSFCTFDKSIAVMARLSAMGYELLPVMSDNAYSTTTRFGKANDIVSRIESICGKSVIHSITDAEPIGPKALCDLLVVAPCTGNTLSKIALGITDTPVTMAVKSQLRIGAPVLLAVASNDALGASAENIAKLMNRKNIYFVPMKQDDPTEKPTSLVARFDAIPDCVELALRRRQPQPVLEG